ncbi:MAG: DNA-processing protein DprA [Thermodesulfobacteriota bacterium]
MPSVHDWLTLALVPGMGPVTMRRLLERFGDPAAVLAASRESLAGVPGLKPALAAAIVTQPPRQEADRILARSARLGARILTWEAEDYPENLRTIPDPPLVLHILGNILAEDRLAVAMVGSRDASGYGLAVANRLAAGLAGCGVAVVSGLARGIDGAAHQGALAAGGRTLAVLGCGLDRIYPPAHAALFREIAGKGAIVTELPLGTRPSPWHFPARNRIISGLALGVVVVEASGRSGSLITATLALDQGREVFAVPGRVDSATSEGTHRLLQQGAKLVQNETDILEELRLTVAARSTVPAPASPPAPARPREQERILGLLAAGPLDIDAIIHAAAMPAAAVSEALLLLELAGLVTVLPGRRYQGPSGPGRGKT